MGVTIEVKEGSVAEITGPAKIVVTSDVPGSVLIDGESVMKPIPDIPPPDPPAPPEAPQLDALSPDTAIAGDATDITMIVNGSGFDAGSVIVFAGQDEPTTLIDDTQVSTVVKPSLFVAADDVPVMVRNGPTAVSNELTFSFTDAASRSSGSGTRSKKK
jgi:hypothetical protein